MIAIISLLVAISIPVLGTARSAARGAQCTSNLRMIFSAASLVAADHGFFPSMNRDNQNNPSLEGGDPWCATLLRQRYLDRRDQVINGTLTMTSSCLLCLSNTRDPNAGLPLAGTGTPPVMRSNYAVNNFWGSDRNTSGSPNRLKPSEITNPRAIYALDYISYAIRANTTANIRWDSPTCQLPKALHGSGLRAVMANGGVVTITPASHPDIENQRHWDPRN